MKIQIIELAEATASLADYAKTKQPVLVTENGEIVAAFCLLENSTENSERTNLDLMEIVRRSQARQQEELEATFDRLVTQWKTETRGVSSTEQLSMNPAYQQIIGMGGDAIPLLLRELEKKSGRWFWALKSITREDPVAPEQQGNTKAMVSAWLNWGREKGYTW